jgi:protein tyrosine phosphatase (PTP) superfamily phosphohydrolase (DUF442 family)
MRRWLRMSAVLVLLAIVIGCQQPQPTIRTLPKIEKLALSGLHNSFRVSGQLYSGSEPEGDVGFASLKSLGIRTVISVDGTEPDIAKAHVAGLTYIHLPVGYDGISDQRRLELVKAYTLANGPVYVHCHHGKHRGPAACTVLMLGTNPDWTPDVAQDWLRLAGTDERYRGLFGLPQHYRKPTDSQLSAIPDRFPEVAEVPSLTRRMVGVDHHWTSIKTAKEAKWSNPGPTADVVLLLLQEYREAQRLKDSGEQLKKLFAEAEATTVELEKALRRESRSEIDKQFQLAAGQCTACHQQERDNRSGRR